VFFVRESTVRYWLRRHGVTNRATEQIEQMREARATDQREIERTCAKHGKTKFILEGRNYYRCARCRAERVAGRRRKIKQQLVSEADAARSAAMTSRSQRSISTMLIPPRKRLA
jgi:hypothetical protein